MEIRDDCSLCEGAAFLIVDATRYAGCEDYLRPCKFMLQASYCPSCGRELPCKPTATVGYGGDGVGLGETKGSVMNDGNYVGILRKKK